MSKVITLESALEKITDGAVIMVGGFMGNGSPEKLIDAIVAKGVKDITLICNDTGLTDKGVGKWIVNKQIKKVIASHIGLNRETGNQMNAGEIQVDLVPQGTLVEQIRCAGYGLGGFLTRTGVGTLVEEGKQKLTVEGVDYLLETPLKADLALLFASTADLNGNLTYQGSMNNFNHVMASAADVTIVEAGEVVELGGIDPIRVMTPGVFVNYIVDGGAING